MTGRNPADHELRYLGAASLSICVECGETFDTGVLRP